MKIKFKLSPDEVDSLLRGQQIFVPNSRMTHYLLEVELDDDVNLIEYGRHMSLDGFHLRKTKKHQDW